MPYALPSFLKCCSVGSGDLLFWVFLTATPIVVLLFLLVHCLFAACTLLWALAAPLYKVSFAVHGGIACLHIVCWDSLSGFMVTCWDSLSGFPGM